MDSTFYDPHKPLLLLYLLEIAAEGGLTQEIMPITSELAFRFASYWGSGVRIDI